MQNIMLVTIAGVFLGTSVFIIGIALVIIDLLIALTIEQFLLSKSFGEIMKGEH